MNQILRRQPSRSHYGSKIPAVTITVFKYRNKIGKIVVKNTLNVFQLMAEFCVPLHQKWKVTKQIVMEIYVLWLQSINIKVWQCPTYRCGYPFYLDLYTITKVACCQIRCSTKIQFISVIYKYYRYRVARTNVIW